MEAEHNYHAQIKLHFIDTPVSTVTFMTSKYTWRAIKFIPQAAGRKPDEWRAPCKCGLTSIQVTSAHVNKSSDFLSQLYLSRQPGFLWAWGTLKPFGLNCTYCFKWGTFWSTTYLKSDVTPSLPSFELKNNVNIFFKAFGEMFLFVSDSCEEVSSVWLTAACRLCRQEARGKTTQPFTAAKKQQQAVSG